MVVGAALRGSSSSGFGSWAGIDARSHWEDSSER